MTPGVDPAAGSTRRRVLIADDHPMLRAGLSQLIDKQPDLAVAGEAGSPAEAFHEISRSRPDLLLADLTMPGRSGLDFIRDVLALHAGLPILVLSMHDETIYAERALRAGARGYIMKESGGEELLAAIRLVLGGRVYLSPELSARVLNDLSGPKSGAAGSPINTLSSREFEVFQLVGHGKRTSEIALQLGISPKTVDVHRAHLKQKLELKDATALVRYAVRWVETEAAGPSGLPA